MQILFPGKCWQRRPVQIYVSFILIENLIGETVEEGKGICTKFIDYVDGKDRVNEPDKNFAAFEAVDEFPERRSCAVLAWEELDERL
ncbi:MAG: NifU-like protein involved in Fe-S cluster formation [Polaribacter sp.]|jgi:NifU-like protein involved in Fe-S cluster formation